MNVCLYLGQIFYFHDNPALYSTQAKGQAYCYLADGALLVDSKGEILACGEAKDLCQRYPAAARTDYRPYLIMPGWIDTHTHYPQAAVVASYGATLLDWLARYTFPAEARFAEKAYAEQAAAFFLAELFRQGTTSACVYPTSHTASVEALFTAAQQHEMRLIAGKVLMDRNAPSSVCEANEQAIAGTRALIARWHKKGRLLYALTPRFAPTSSPQQLRSLQALKEEFSDLYIQTHLAETQAELAWVATLFPKQRSYLEVYDHFGLLGAQSIFAHCLHLSEENWQRLAAAQCCISHCPSSNLFLGSGLFPWRKTADLGLGLTLGSDVGGGTSFSLLRTLQAAYQVSALAGSPLNSLDAFYALTLGAAKALGLDSYLGSLTPGKEADFIVIKGEATPLQTLRWQQAESWEEKLFSLMILGDDRNIAATYVKGKKVHAQ